MLIRRSPERRPSPPSTGWSQSPVAGGRDQSERLVAINRNNWSPSPGARTQMLLDLRSRPNRWMVARAFHIEAVKRK